MNMKQVPCISVPCSKDLMLSLMLQTLYLRLKAFPLTDIQTNRQKLDAPKNPKIHFKHFQSADRQAVIVSY